MIIILANVSWKNVRLKLCILDRVAYSATMVYGFFEKQAKTLPSDVRAHFEFYFILIWKTEWLFVKDSNRKGNSVSYMSVCRRPCEIYWHFFVNLSAFTLTIHLILSCGKNLGNNILFKHSMSLQVKVSKTSTCKNDKDANSFTAWGS